MFVAIAQFPEVPTERVEEFQAWFAWSNGLLREIDGREVELVSGPRTLRTAGKPVETVEMDWGAERWLRDRTTLPAGAIEDLSKNYGAILFGAALFALVLPAAMLFRVLKTRAPVAPRQESV